MELQSLNPEFGSTTWSPEMALVRSCCCTVYDSMLMKPKLSDETMWHFNFHNAQNNLAESLTAGRERL